MTFEDFTRLGFTEKLRALSSNGEWFLQYKRWGYDVHDIKVADHGNGDHFFVRLFFRGCSIVRITTSWNLKLSVAEFEQLDWNKKHELIERCGKYLATRKWGKSSVDLYHLPASGHDARSPNWGETGLFIQVYTEKNQEVRFKAFRSMKGLEPYLREISLADLQD